MSISQTVLAALLRLTRPAKCHSLNILSCYTPECFRSKTFIWFFSFTVFRNVFSVWPQKISLASLTIAHCWIMPSVNWFSQEGSFEREPWVFSFFFFFSSLFQSHNAEVHVRMLVISLSLSVCVDVNLSVPLVVIWHSPCGRAEAV